MPDPLNLFSRILSEFGDWPEARSGSGGHKGGPITPDHSLYDAVGSLISELPDSHSLRKLWARIKTLSRKPEIQWDLDGEPHGEFGEKLLTACDNFRDLLRHFEPESNLKLGKSSAEFLAMPIGGAVELMRELAMAPGNDGKEPESRPKRKKSKASEMNLKAMEIAKKEPEFARKPNVRKWAKRLGCGSTLVSGLPFYIQCAEAAGTLRRGKPRKPKAAPLTEAVLDTVGVADLELQALIDEQEADYEPSPLDGSTKRNPKVYRKV